MTRRMAEYHRSSQKTPHLGPQQVLDVAEGGLRDANERFTVQRPAKRSQNAELVCATWVVRRWKARRERCSCWGAGVEDRPEVEKGRSCPRGCPEWFIRKLNNHVTGQYLFTAYHALFHSHVSYGLILWGRMLHVLKKSCDYKIGLFASRPPADTWTTAGYCFAG